MIFDDLRAIQLRYGFLPKEELEGLSQRTLTPLYQLHSVASFYPHFRLAPPAKAEIRVCADMSFDLNGALPAAAPKRCRAAAITRRRYRSTMRFLPRLLPRGLSKWLAEPHPERARVECKADPYGDRDDKKYGVLRRLVESRAWDDVLAQLKAADLRGMGGAGFPTSVKWDLVRKQRDPVKYVVCNADESETGTIKDRFIMTHLPHLVIEGMIIDGVVTGAKRGILYIRHEYGRGRQAHSGGVSRAHGATMGN